MDEDAEDILRISGARGMLGERNYVAHTDGSPRGGEWPALSTRSQWPRRS